MEAKHLFLIAGGFVAGTAVIGGIMKPENAKQDKTSLIIGVVLGAGLIYFGVAGFKGNANS